MTSGLPCTRSLTPKERTLSHPGRGSHGFLVVGNSPFERPSRGSPSGSAGPFVPGFASFSCVAPSALQLSARMPSPRHALKPAQRPECASSSTVLLTVSNANLSNRLSNVSFYVFIQQIFLRASVCQELCYLPGYMGEQNRFGSFPCGAHRPV